MKQRWVDWWNDAWRFWLALLHWNTIKTLHVLRGPGRRAPCQDPSDDDRPGCSHCYGIIDWREPARFQRVCPFLEQGPHGWRCAVASDQVRPFWGRVLAWYGGALAALYLGLSVAVWGGLWLAGGGGIGWTEVAWPGSWHRIAEVQSERFFQQSILAFRHGRLNEAYVALNSACIRNPRNYDARLLMAQIDMFRGNYPFSDQGFGRLLKEVPAQRERTAVTYHDTLLSLNRLPELAEFSLAMAVNDPAHAALWMRSLLLAVRSGRVAPGLLETHAASVDKLAPHAQLLLRAAVAAAAGRPAEAGEWLRPAFRGPLNGRYMEEQIRGLLLLGDWDQANTLLLFYAMALGRFETQAQAYLIDSVAGDAWRARADFAGMLKEDLTATRVQRLLVLLIRQPDQELFQQLHQRVWSQPALREAVPGPAMWATALVCGAAKEGRLWRTTGQQYRGDDFPPIERIDFSRGRIDEPESVIHLINMVTLPREVIFALLARREDPGLERKRALRQREG